MPDGEQALDDGKQALVVYAGDDRSSQAISIEVLARALADAQAPEDVLPLEKELSLAERYMRDSGLYTSDQVRQVNELRMRARWRLGQLLAAIERAPGPGRGKKMLTVSTSFRALLAKLELDSAVALHAQRIGALPGVRRGPKIWRGRPGSRSDRRRLQDHSELRRRRSRVRNVPPAGQSEFFPSCRSSGTGRRRLLARSGRTRGLVAKSAAFGEHRYGERKALVESDDWQGPIFQTCMDAANTCRAFETYRRREVLSFSHRRSRRRRGSACTAVRRSGDRTRAAPARTPRARFRPDMGRSTCRDPAAMIW
jgi:hypothetical protein